jgi:hypothetical protein
LDDSCFGVEGGLVEFVGLGCFEDCFGEGEVLGVEDMIA